MTNKKETKEVTLEQFNEFWELFHKRHPELDMQLPSTRVLLNGSIYCNQPATMPKEIYDIYFRFLRRWYMDNDFIPFAPDFVYVSLHDGLNKTAMEIDTSTITDIKPVTTDLTSVTITRDGVDNTVVIKENVDYFKNRVYIF